MDSLSRAERSAVMARIGPRNTTPELTVLAIVRRLGFRPGRYVRRLPGSPDVVVTAVRTVVFVHGCFWHRHHCRRGASQPSTRPDFWREKFRDNVRRDRRTARALRRLGWRVLTVWECQVKPSNAARLENRLNRLLTAARPDDR